MVAFSVLVLVNLLCHDLTPQEASDPQPTAIDERAEPWRAAVEKAMQAYVKEHYPNGVLTVSGLGLVACVLEYVIPYTCSWKFTPGVNFRQFWFKW